MTLQATKDLKLMSELRLLRDVSGVLLAALKAAAPHVPVEIQSQVINAINIAADARVVR